MVKDVKMIQMRVISKYFSTQDSGHNFKKLYLYKNVKKAFILSDS